MRLSASDISGIVTALQESDWDEAVVTIGDVTIAVARNGAQLHSPAPVHAAPTKSFPGPPLPASAATPPSGTTGPMPTTPVDLPVSSSKDKAPSTPGPADSTDSTDYVVTAPSVGVVWRAPEPGAAPFAEVGGRLEIGDTLCIVEIMKLMNNVASPVSGIVTAVHVGNGTSVEFGTPLFSIRVDGN